MPFLPDSTHAEHRVRSKRGNLSPGPQRDQKRNVRLKEVLRDLPLRDCGTEAPHARPGAPTSDSRQGRAASGNSYRHQRLRRARHSLQRQEHGITTTSARLVSSRMRPAYRRLSAIDLQLGGGQSPPARPTPAGHLCASEPRSSASKRDPGKQKGRVDDVTHALAMRSWSHVLMDGYEDRSYAEHNGSS